MRAIIFDAFGTLFRVTSGGSAKTIMKNITDCGMVVDEDAFLEEWKSYYKNHTLIKTVWIDRNGMGGNIGQDYTITDLNGLIAKDIQLN